MIPKRVKQFYINATDKMRKEDIDYVEKILNKEELALFYQLSTSEQKHSVRISREIFCNINNKTVNDKIMSDKEILIKAALLHDIGKIKARINIIEKSIIVILNKITKGKLRNISKSKKIQCYYNHSQYSYDILKDKGYEEKLLYIIKNHHDENYEDELLRFFQIMDDKN